MLSWSPRSANLGGSGRFATEEKCRFVRTDERLFKPRYGPYTRGCREKEGFMTQEKRAELYTSPGGKFIRSDSLPRMLAHWWSFRKIQKQTHLIKFDGEFYAGEDVGKLHASSL
jgi:hypothetical protein